jgi:hypothetical protein
MFDEKTCGKKLETLNRIADHICKNHLSKIDFSSKLSYSNNEVNEEQKSLFVKLNKNPMCFNNLLIVRKYSYTV